MPAGDGDAGLYVTGQLAMLTPKNLRGAAEQVILNRVPGQRGSLGRVRRVAATKRLRPALQLPREGSAYGRGNCRVAVRSGLEEVTDDNLAVGHPAHVSGLG